VGDHGEGLGDHGELAHGYFIYDFAVHVPLIISTPDKSLQNRRVPLEVSTVDIFPTIVEMSGLKARASQGRSLLSMMSGRKEKEIPAYCESMSPSLHYGWSPLLGLRTSQFKFIDAPRPELYDLKSDPEEGRDVQNKFPEAGLNFKDSLIPCWKKSVRARLNPRRPILMLKPSSGWLLSVILELRSSSKPGQLKI